MTDYSEHNEKQRIEYVATSIDASAEIGKVAATWSMELLWYR